VTCENTSSGGFTSPDFDGATASANKGPTRTMNPKKWKSNRRIFSILAKKGV